MSARLILTREAASWPPKWRAARRIYHDRQLGMLSIEHDGSITWDELQEIKNHMAGEEAAAIEVYPPAGRVVNNIAMRHLWLLGSDDWWPDLGGDEGTARPSTLRDRYLAVQQSTSGGR
ncbi:hypothetical protein FJ422_16465 [Mesorhizobium sp. B2-6-3]|uniref:DUF7694 domain-containing protein n=1 Tax=Mesorhizobium sp. B2-6-3 TaxID=2589914 RepID=UPI00112D9871|nr:hypothetical protein [Mesorhizobium sp. B2-6-3]TPJ83866.1 hypothetical protein FJ422_16465 [Mesorhizobium sp. B2-6-3]